MTEADQRGSLPPALPKGAPVHRQALGRGWGSFWGGSAAASPPRTPIVTLLSCLSFRVPFVLL